MTRSNNKSKLIHETHENIRTRKFWSSLDIFLFGILMHAAMLYGQPIFQYFTAIQQSARLTIRNSYIEDLRLCIYERST